MSNKGSLITVVLNCGSSSLKYQVLDMSREQLLCKGLVERIGQADGLHRHVFRPGSKQEQIYEQIAHFSDHDAALQRVAEVLTDPEQGGVLKSADEIAAVGHRVVLGSPDQSEVLINKRVKEMIRSYAPLSPLHNPVNLVGIEVAERLWPGKPNVAVFDTGFHSSMPAKAYTYGIDRETAKRFMVRRYGYHGTSHRFVAQNAARLAKRKLSSLNLISCHLGAGCSICAIQKGQSVDTSMGLTPLGGLVMASRCGDLDPAIVTYLMENTGFTPAEMNNYLNQQAGLKGLCGHTDMREILAARQQGDADSQLAFDVFCHTVRKFIGASFAVLDGVDGLIFTGGIGENAPEVRAEICKNLKHLGIELDQHLNRGKERGARQISTISSPMSVYVIPTNEELEIARATLRVVASAML